MRIGGKKLLAAAALAFATPSNAQDLCEVVFVMDLPGDILSNTHGGSVGLALHPADIAPLSGANETGLALTSVVRNGEGEVIGFASELEEFPEGMSGEWLSWWTVVIPGLGTVIGFETEAIAEAHLTIFEQVSRGESWSGEVDARIATGPLPDGNGTIIAGTGAFEGVTGSMSEWTRLTSLEPTGVMTGELRLVAQIANDDGGTCDRFG